MNGAPSGPVAASGMRVALEMVYQSGETEMLDVHIVPDEQADFEAGFLGEGTPLARAVMGHSAGSVLPYPVGDAKEVRILAVTPPTVEAPKDVAARRSETLRKAVADSDKANAIIFAASFSGKWGDYDPAPLEENWDPRDADDE